LAGPAATEAQIRSALDRLLAWEEIARSGQLAKFLAYIVDAKLRGEDDTIKAYSIAVDVFGRPPSFDPQSDPIVRVQARRLRALLDQYYDIADQPGPVRIRLPVGRYVPEFELLENGQGPEAILPAGTGEEASNPEWPSRSALARPASLAGLALLALVVLGLGTWWLVSVLGPRAPALPPDVPQAPRIAVLEFQDLTGNESYEPAVGGLALELVTDLALFEDIEPSFGRDPAALGSPPLGAEANSYVLSGIARVSEGQVQYGAILKRQGENDVLWSHAVSMPLALATREQSVDVLSRRFALMIGSHRGPLDRTARDWLAARSETAAIATPYICRLLFHVQRDTGAAADARRAEGCVAGLRQREGETALVLAVEAGLLIGAWSRGEIAAGESEDVLDRAAALIDRALALAPTSSFAWEQSARVKEARQEMAQARADYAAALQLNPANDDALAAYGRMLALTSGWAAGAEAALTAVTGTPEPPPWYHLAMSLNALRARQFANAARYAEIVASGDRELGPVVAVVAAMASDRVDLVNRYLPQVLEAQQFRQQGIIPQVARHISDPALLELVREQLVRARVPEAALAGPF